MADAAVERAEADLAGEAEEDAQLRQSHGAAWNRPTSTALNASLREKAAGYRFLRHPSFRFGAMPSAGDCHRPPFCRPGAPQSRH